MLCHFFVSDMLQIDVNACITAKEVGGVSSNNGGRLGEFEGINGIFVKSKQNSSRA